jgi:4-diphosphocytidyl-2C-methyl-D-erythritol kinase
VTGRIAYRAFAKINLGLHVGAMRPDGFHEVRTVLQSVALCDLLEVHPSEELSLTCSDPSLPAGEDNLVMRAARALQRAVSCERGARITLTKRIPSQAGLGGGSSDAAAALVALARLWRIPFSCEDLVPVAAALGADVPFFLVGGTALGVSGGEEVYALPDAPALHLVLALPKGGMPTAEAYRRLDAGRRSAQVPTTGAMDRPHAEASGDGTSTPSPDVVPSIAGSRGARRIPPKNADRSPCGREVRLTPPGGPHRIASLVQALVEGRLSEKCLFNDFEAVNEEAGSENASVRRALRATGARTVIPAGSGAAWVGFFPDRTLAAEAQRKLVQRGVNAIHTGSITRRDYWEQTVPTWVKE